jgi:hypothetical protein
MSGDINISFRGYGNKWQSDMLKSRFTATIQPILERGGMAGNFIVQIQDKVKGHERSLGIHFIKFTNFGVTIKYYEAAGAHHQNAECSISAPTGMSPEVFFHKLKEAQNELHLLAKKESNMNAQLKVEQNSIFDDQFRLSVVLSSLRAKATEQCSEILNAETAMSVIVTALECTVVEASQILSDLCEGEILSKKGVGKFISYAVTPAPLAPANTKGEDASHQSDVGQLLESLPHIIERAKSLQSELPKFRQNLKDEIESLARCRARIPELEQKINDVSRQIKDAQAFLDAPGTVQALALAKTLKSVVTE